MTLANLIKYIHYFAILIILISVIWELIIVRKTVSIKRIKLITKVNKALIISAILTLISGLLRMLYFGKGADYYLSNTLFVTKLSVFAVFVLLIIYPSITFCKTRKLNIDNVKINRHKLIKLITVVELILLLYIPYLAAMVSKGIN